MKANKALKRLTKIEALMSDVTERYSATTPHLREVLQGAEDAVARAKEAVSLQVTKAATAKEGRAAKKATPAQKKPGVKKVAANAQRAKTAKKNTPSKSTAKQTATAPVGRAATKTAAL
jgi:hypothetical protein